VAGHSTSCSACRRRFSSICAVRSADRHPTWRHCAFYSNAPRILYRHQQIALDVLGLIRFDSTSDSPRVLEAIGDKVRAGVDADKLLAETRVMHSHAIARTWGSPFDCAADAMSLDMPEYIWYTSPDPKRRVAGAATYVHTHGWQGIFSDRSIMITQRQPGPAIGGILGQELSKIARVYTDTHGFSAYGGSLGWALGILLCPRLKNFNDRRLHVPSGGHIRIPENLKAVVLPDISLKSIQKGWLGHLKVADAVVSGRLSATTAIELQGAARHGDASFRAGHAHGLCCARTICCAPTQIPTTDARSCAT
jgi:hypothetical protein